LCEWLRIGGDRKQFAEAYREWRVGENKDSEAEMLDLRLVEQLQQAKWKREKRSARDALLVCTKTIFYLSARALLHSRSEI